MIHIGITTFNRPNMLLSLLKDIKSFNIDVNLVIYNDGSNKDYTNVSEYLNKNFNSYCLLEGFRNKGKTLYWDVFNNLKNELQHDVLNDDYVFIIPDDVKLVEDFFDLAIETYDELSEKYKCVALNLLNVTKGISFSQWFKDNVVEIDTQRGVEVLGSGYVDMAFCCYGKYFNEIKDIEKMKAKASGSGVGKHVSSVLRTMGKIFQVKHSLLIHGIHKSYMNTQERQVHPLVSNENIYWCRK